jgi:hypothetical protein
MMVNLFSVLREAIEKTPFVKYALGITGIAAAVAIIGSFGVENYRKVPVITIVIMFALMVLLFLFSRLMRSNSKPIEVAGYVLVYTVVVIMCGGSLLMLTSVFFDYPKPIDKYGFLNTDGGQKANDSSSISGGKEDAVADLPTDVSFIESLEKYTSALIHGKEGLAVDTNERYAVADLYHADSCIYLLIIRRNERKGKNWTGEGIHHLSTVFAMKLSDDKTVSSHPVLQDVYLSGHGCISASLDTVSTFVNFKNKQDERAYFWRGMRCDLTFESPKIRTDEIFTGANSGFYPYFEKGGVRHYNFGGVVFLDDKRVSDEPPSDEIFEQHLKIYRDSVYKHSRKLLLDPINIAEGVNATGQNNFEFAKLMTGIRVTGWFK